MSGLLFSFLYILLAIMYAKLFRRYNIGISFAERNFAGFLIFREMFTLIGLSAILLNSFPIYFFNGFDNTSQDSIFLISLIIWLALFFYVISLYLGTNLTYKWFNKKQGAGKDLNNLLLVSVLFGFLIYMILFVFFGVKHAFFDTLFRGGDLLSIRLDNKYATNAPSFLFSILNISTFFSIILFSFSTVKIKFLKVIYIFIFFVLLTYSGGKAPLIYGLIIYGLIKLTTLKHIKINMRFLIRLFFSFLLFLVLLFFVVKVQFPEFGRQDFLIYFVNRLGVGQIAGTYEQFNLKLYNDRYIYHSIPFASLFFEYPIFQKDLMLISESVYDPNSTGLKNSLFISEASSFGIFFLIISPFVVGFNTAISIALLAVFLSKMYINDRLLSFKISSFIFLSVNTITGGFSDYLFFKSLALILISLIFIVSVAKILDLLFKK